MHSWSLSGPRIPTGMLTPKDNLPSQAMTTMHLTTGTLYMWKLRRISRKWENFVLCKSSRWCGFAFYNSVSVYPGMSLPTPRPCSSQTVPNNGIMHTLVWHFLWLERAASVWLWCEDQIDLYSIPGGRHGGEESRPTQYVDCRGEAGRPSQYGGQVDPLNM